MKETACQSELALMLDKKELAWSLMDNCHECPLTTPDRPVHCLASKCHVGIALITSGYAIPLRSECE